MKPEVFEEYKKYHAAVWPDILDMIRRDGMEHVEDNLDAWLNEASEMGSGDDITLALLSRTAREEAANAD